MRISAAQRALVLSRKLFTRCLSLLVIAVTLWTVLAPRELFAKTGYRFHS